MTEFVLISARLLINKRQNLNTDLLLTRLTMKTQLTTLALLFLCYSGVAQTQQDQSSIEKVELLQVREWINENPEVKLVSLEHFNQVSVAERDELTNYSPCLLHQGSIPTWSEVQAFIASGYTDGELNKLAVHSDLLFIENWMQANPEVKILRLDQLMELNAEQRAEMLAMDNLIVCDGRLTVADINAYESN